MNQTLHIENVVLGGGEAGKYLAWDLAQQGRPVVVIERALIGGSCPSIACLPSKNVIRSAKVADLVSRAASYGVRTEGATVDMTGVRQRKREMVDGMIAIHRRKFAVRISSSSLPKASLWGRAQSRRDLLKGARAALSLTACF